MYCQRCGSEITDNAKFCGKCGGNQFIDKPTDINTNNNVSTSNAKDLIDSNEQIIATLGNGYGVNLLYGKAKKCHAILTDKRVYLNGALYTGDGKILKKVTMHQVLDIEDITGTGFIYSRLSKWMLFTGIIMLIAGCFLGQHSLKFTDVSLIIFPITWILGIILLAKVFLNNKTFFFIQYAGGSIRFNANIVGLSDVADFHKQIRRVKDKMKNK